MKIKTARAILRQYRNDEKYPLTDIVYEEDDCIEAMKEYEEQFARKHVLYIRSLIIPLIQAKDNAKTTQDLFHVLQEIEKIRTAFTQYSDEKK